MHLEQTGIEPATQGSKSGVLPLNYHPKWAPFDANEFIGKTGSRLKRERQGLGRFRRNVSGWVVKRSGVELGSAPIVNDPSSFLSIHHNFANLTRQQNS